MKAENKVPAIRFEGFSGDWESKQVLDIAPLQRGFDLPNSQLKHGEYPVVMSNGVSVYHDAFKAEAPGVITGRSGTIGNVHYIETNYWPHNTALWVTDFKGNSPRFIYYLYTRINLKKFGTGSGVPTLNRNDVHEQIVSLPKLEKEQTAIGDYFQKLDRLINQHQQKHQQLSNLKQAMLEKMFPKAGKTTPEIRFQGFNDDWEEKELGEIGNTFTGLSGKTKDDFGHGDARYVTYLNVFANAITNTNLLEPIGIDAKQNEVKKGDVFFTTSSETPEEVGMSSVWMGEVENVYLNSFCFGFRPEQEIDSYYLAYLLRSNSFREKVVILAQGVSRYNISKTRVMDIKIVIPNSKKEQTAIGNYFQKLDQLINQHQEQISKLNHIKQACLIKMFV